MTIVCRIAASLCSIVGGKQDGAKVEEQYPRPWRPSSCGKDRSIETMRLRLRRLRPSDEPETLDRVRQRMGADPGALGFWRIESRGDGTFYGLAALIRMPTGDDVELAYRLARRAWGQGIASEAGAALLDYAFHTVQLPRVVAVTYPENRASQRVLDKLGFERQGDVDYKGVRATFFVRGRPAERGR